VDAVTSASARTDATRTLRLPADRWLVTGSLAVALIVRVAIVLASKGHYVPVNDSADFMRIATSIKSGHGFGPTQVPGAHGPSAFRTPLYPALLAALFSVTGVSVTAGRLFTALVSTGFVAAFGALGWRLGGRRMGLVCLIAAAVYPPFLLASYGLQYEAVFLLLTTLALLAALQWRLQPERIWLLVAAGLLTGLAVLCRETAALVLVPVWVFIWQGRRTISGRRLFALLGTVTVSALVVVVPWTIRNAVTLHAFIPVSDSPDEALAGSYNATTLADTANLGRWIVPYGDPTDLRLFQALGPSPTEEQVMSMYRTAATNYIEDHPASVPKMVGWNTVRLFDLRGFQDATYLAPYVPWNTRLVKLSVVSFWILAPIAVAGLFTRRARSIPKAVWAYPVLMFLTLVFTTADIQYRVALEPFFLILGAAAAVTWYERRVLRGSGAGSPTGTPSL
jgi:4-amino-4-deoxy-L-arabinose transferase-like glycosyltransferase